MLAFKALTEPERRTIDAFLAGTTVVDLDGTIKTAAIQMRLSGLRLPDAVVAATALVRGAELLTHDAKLLKLSGIATRVPALK